MASRGTYVAHTQNEVDDLKQFKKFVGIPYSLGYTSRPTRSANFLACFLR